jgi:hypothetical protein
MKTSEERAEEIYESIVIPRKYPENPHINRWGAISLMIVAIEADRAELLDEIGKMIIKHYQEHRDRTGTRSISFEGLLTEFEELRKKIEGEGK